MTAARDGKLDVLLIDTAGRLQNKAELMNELEKKSCASSRRSTPSKTPHAVLLVLDATVGQNALSQVEAFHRTAGVTGLVMTKLDGTARGGILVALAEKHKLPVHFIGVGEGIRRPACLHRTGFRRRRSQGLKADVEFLHAVIAGLDPAIHPLQRTR